MRLESPRVAPLEDHEFDAAQKAAVVVVNADRKPIINIVRTLKRNPSARVAFGHWRLHPSDKSRLTPREHESLVRRARWLCRSGYEFTQHLAFADYVSGLTIESPAGFSHGRRFEDWEVTADVRA